MVRFGKIEALGGPRARRKFAGLCVLLLAAGTGVAADGPGSCTAAPGRVVSLQGTVELLRSGASSWQRITRLNAAVCAGDQLRAGLLSRVAILISPETLVRLDQNTTLAILSQTEQETIVEFKQDDATRSRAARAQACGIGYFIARFPRKFRVRTPFYNAVVEGTEFQVALQCDRGDLSVFEGKVVAEDIASSANRVVLESGQSVSVGPGETPRAVKVLVKPTDAVQWAVYYPPVSDVPASVEDVLAEACEAIPDPERGACAVRHAEALLRVGRVGEAGAELDRLLDSEPSNAEGLALNAVIAITKNDNARALELSTKATQVGPQSFRAWVALSYARQAGFRLKDALSAADRAAQLAPKSALVRGRVAELLMSLGRIRDAEREARRAVSLNPNESRAHLILGYVHLAQVDITAAKQDFNTAVELDSTEPLARLGLGLAIIREGKLPEGREQIEIAVALDPTDSLLRSYVGKAYYEENTRERDRLAATQLELAKQLDPNDPTPWYYDAILKQAQNRPVEAVEDLQKSIAVNDNRAVYRSRVLLDDDSAARSATLATMYQQIGFGQLALAEARLAVEQAPANPSGHRFIAEASQQLPRYEIARLSEALQYQLRQPLNANPLPPEFLQDQMFILRGAGPTDPGYREYNSLFNRNQVGLRLDGLAGDRNTRGSQAQVLGLGSRTACNAGAFNYNTDGIRREDAVTREAYLGYCQVQLSPDLSLQTELRYQDSEYSELLFGFDPASATLLTTRTRGPLARVGGHARFGPDADAIFAVTYREEDVRLDYVDYGFVDQAVNRGTTAEAQGYWRGEGITLLPGVAFFDGHAHAASADRTRSHENAYLYGMFSMLHDRATVSVGASWDDMEEPEYTRRQINPKLGIQFTPLPGTRLRAAAFQTVQRQLISNQTIEPTQVAGFNQFFNDDANGSVSKRAGIGWDQRLSDRSFAGLEVTWRQIEEPLVLGPDSVKDLEHRERSHRGYLYYAASKKLTAGIDVFYDSVYSGPDNAGVHLISEATTIRTALSATALNPFGVSGLSAKLAASYVDQTVTYVDFFNQPFPQSDAFWIEDASISYLLPRRQGFLSITVRNLFDQQFRYQELDPANPILAPGRLVFARVNLFF